MAINFNPLPAAGDIVWCHFPQHEELGQPGPKPRPGLILNAFPALHAVLIAYGTSQKTGPGQIYPGEFVIDDQLDTAGLCRPTKFDLNKIEKLPFTADWFQIAPGFEKKRPLPKMGVLPPAFVSVMRSAWQNRT